ncbi:MAG: MBL fold metallo-hydrolase [Candidatus Aminicenantes bacterium]|nr:MBL fold metallo-hydrolase [Candidatus Aminicenantes bacterium]
MHEKDTFKTDRGDLEITFIGHGSLAFNWAGKVVHVDPVSAEADYAKLAKADLIIVTHDHYDHLDLKAAALLTKTGTAYVADPGAGEQLEGATILRNGDSAEVLGVKIEAVPAYNLVHMRAPGQPFHPKGVGNGYVLTFGGTRVYIGGDTENIPEMKTLRDIDIAFLPMNLPYTMTPEMVADAARMFKPRVLYPYHTGETDTSKLRTLLQDEKGVEVRLRRMK